MRTGSKKTFLALGAMSFVVGCSFLGGGKAVEQEVAEETVRPNILMIYTDDMNFEDIAAFWGGCLHAEHGSFNW